MAGSVRVSGDFERLSRITRGVSVTGDAVRGATLDLRPAVLEQYQRGFSEKRDPYGRTWAERLSGAPWPLMVRTAALANPTITAVGYQIRLKTERYGKFHQYGRRPRKMLPYESGSSWEAPLSRVLEESIGSYYEAL